MGLLASGFAPAFDFSPITHSAQRTARPLLMNEGEIVYKKLVEAPRARTGNGFHHEEVSDKRRQQHKQYRCVWRRPVAGGRRGSGVWS